MQIDKYGESMTLLERAVATHIFEINIRDDGYEEYLKTLTVPTKPTMKVGDLVRIIPSKWKPNAGKREWCWRPIISSCPFGKVTSDAQGGFIQVNSLRTSTSGMAEWSIFVSLDGVRKMSFFEKIFWRWL